MPFDYGSFFTPRFPVLSQIKRDRSNEPLGPELPPELINKYAMEEQEQLPEWKKKVRGLFESGVDATAGMLGLPAYPETKSYGMGELTNAGIPFLALGKKLGLPEISGKPVVWRGDPGISEASKTYKDINQQYFNLQDTLGYMGHAAENPNYAIKNYMYRKGSPYRPTQVESYGYNPAARPNLTAVTAPSSRNAVDVTRLPEDLEDVEKLVNGLKMWDPRRSPFGSGERLDKQKAQELAEEIPSLWRLQQPIDKKLREGVPLTMREQRDLDHIGDMMDNIRVPLNDPEITDKLGFDAIRYTDVGNTSWAFPDVSKMETPWGTKLGQKSMGDYRYRVTTADNVNAGTWQERIRKEDLGYFKTQEEAMRAAAEYGPGHRVYRGSRSDASPLVTVPGEKNIDVKRNRIPGLEDYLSRDKGIQQQISNTAVKKYPIAGEKSLQDGYAKKMYKDSYENLNDWQKWDIDSKIKNDQSSIYKDDTELEDIFDQLGKNLEKETGVGLDDFEADDYLKEPGANQDLIDKLYVNPLKLDTTPGQIQKFKNEGVSYNSVADHFYDTEYKYLDEYEQKHVKDFTDWIEKGAPVKELSGTGWKHYSGPGSEVKSSMGTKEFSVELPEYEDVMGTAQKSKTYKVTDEDIQKFAKKDYLLDEIAEHYYGRSFKDLDKDEAEFIADVHYRAQIIK